MLRLPEQQNQLSVIMLLSKPLASSWAPLLGSCVVPGPTLARVSTAEGRLSRGASFLNAVPYGSCPEEGCMVMKADLFSGGAGCQTWRKARTRNQQSEFLLRQQVSQAAHVLCYSPLLRLFTLPSVGRVFAAVAQGSRAAPG